MFDNKEVAAKYTLVGNSIQHVKGLGAVDFTKISMTEADYFYAHKVKALKLINDPEQKPEPPAGEKLNTKKS